MKTTLLTLAAFLACCALTVGTVSAQVQPTVITPTTISAPHGIAPNGIGATPTELLFSQPFCTGTNSQTRGVYSATGLVANGPVLNATITETLPVADNGCAENYFYISPGLGGFPAGAIFIANPTSANTFAIYRDAAVFVPSITDSDPAHAGMTFDTVGTFANALIVTTSSKIYGFNSAGTEIFNYPTPSGVLLESATVAPIANSACPGCLYVTTGSESSSAPGKIYTLPAGSVSGTALTLAATAPAGQFEPESILFITPQVCTMTGTNFAYLVSGYAAGAQIDHSPSNSGALLAYTEAQITPYIGKALVHFEGSTSQAGSIYVFDPATKVFTLFSTPTPIPSATPPMYQLEGATTVACAPATGCPATQGYWKHHAFPSKMFVNGHVVIGGVSYTAAELVDILNTPPKGGDASLILMHQLIAALANEAAGAQHVGVIEMGVSVDLAIAQAESLLMSGLPQAGFPGSNPAGVVFPINLNNSTGTFVQAGTTLGGYFTDLAGVLDAYNSAVGLNCSEASGLTD